MSALFYREMIQAALLFGLGAVRRNDTSGGGHTCGASKADQWEAGTASVRRDLGDTGGVGSTTGGWDAVRVQLHWPSAGNDSAVGGPMLTPGFLRKVNRLRGRGLEAKVAVESGNNQRDFLGRAERGIPG